LLQIDLLYVSIKKTTWESKWFIQLDLDWKKPAQKYAHTVHSISIKFFLIHSLASFIEVILIVVRELRRTLIMLKKKETQTGIEPVLTKFCEPSSCQH